MSSRSGTSLSLSGSRRPAQLDQALVAVADADQGLELSGLQKRFALLFLFLNKDHAGRLLVGAQGGRGNGQGIFLGLGKYLERHHGVGPHLQLAIGKPHLDGVIAGHLALHGDKNDLTGQQGTTSGSELRRAA